MPNPHKRCAIYTRKSTEAGLEQDFNSLDAQREACVAYIKSQQSEGWEYIGKTYDDGGFSGGTMERPALQQLLMDIASGLVDVIVVYKIDRLTRSLFDFAKIIEQLDKHGASFVSVTQQFNTTTSMGRLTLNVLLSFAQFEREVTAERIRDKIKASKQKGMWMGGVPPLGYDVKNRALVINPQEADIIQTVFSTYLALGTVAKLKAHVDEGGHRTKSWTSRSGKHHSGTKFSRSGLYRLLSNPTYIGDIPHKETTYKGQHAAIVPIETWSLVQAQLKEQWGERKTEKNRKSPSWLVGILKDDKAIQFKSAQTNKNGRMYRYYITEGSMDAGSADGWRLPAREIERAIVSGIADAFRDPVNLLNLSGTEITAPNISAARAAECSITQTLKSPAQLKSILSEIRVTQSQINIDILSHQLRALSGLNELAVLKFAPSVQTLSIGVQLRRRGVESRIVLSTEQPSAQTRDEKLVRLIAKAHVWFEQLKSGERNSIEEIAASEKLDGGDVSRAIPLAFLAPSIVEAILQGKQPVDLTAERLRRMSALPHAWTEQQQALGF